MLFSGKVYKPNLTQINIDREFIEKQFHELSAGLLPFSILPDLCNQLKEQLDEESKTIQWNASIVAITPRILDVQNKINSNDFWVGFNGNISSETRLVLQEQITKMLDGVLIENNDYRRVKVLHLISDQDRARILAWIDEFVNEIPRKAKKIGERLSYLEHKRQDISNKTKKCT